MPQYTVYGWQYSEFAGLISDPVDPADFAGTSGTLRFKATAQSLVLTHPEGTPRAGQQSILAKPVTFDGLECPAGSRMDILFSVDTDDTPAATFRVARLTSAALETESVQLILSDGPLVRGRTYRFAPESAGAIEPQDTLCFAEGTMILTPEGERPVEEIGIGDLVITLGRGSREVRWVGSRWLSPGVLSSAPHLRPIRISAGALGLGRPSRDLVIAPQQRVLLDDWRAEVCFGDSEVLVPAKFLVNEQNIRVDRGNNDLTFHHILTEAHDTVMANGQWCETLFLDDAGHTILTPVQIREIDALLQGGHVCRQSASPLRRVQDAGLLAEF